MENKTSKYFKYAIGEIVLVMIGILLALQVNNWNEDRIKNIQQKILITQLLEDAQADSLFFQSRLVSLDKFDSILTYIDELDHYIDKIQPYTIITNGTGEIFPFSFLNLTSYIMIDYTEEFGKINSFEIKKQMRAFNLKYVYLFRTIENLNIELKTSIEPLRSKYYKELRENKSTKSIDIMNKIYRDEQILSFVDILTSSSSIARTRVNEIIDINNDLIQVIQSNLKEY